MGEFFACLYPIRVCSASILSAITSATSRTVINFLPGIFHIFWQCAPWVRDTITTTMPFRRTIGWEYIGTILTPLSGTSGCGGNLAWHGTSNAVEKPRSTSPLFDKCKRSGETVREGKTGARFLLVEGKTVLSKLSVYIGMGEDSKGTGDVQHFSGFCAKKNKIRH